MNSLTLKDLARELGLAPSTVSRALKGHPDISEETQDRVRRLAEELEYAPDVTAWSLRSRKSKLIALLLPELQNDFYIAFADGAERVLRREDYFLILFSSRDDRRTEEEVCKAVVNGRFGGMLASVARSTTTVAHFGRIKEAGIPLLFFDRIAGMLDTDRVVTDDFQGAYEAVRHLLRQGCRKIVFYACSPHLQVVQKRRWGYTEALHSFHIPVEEELIITGERERAGRLSLKPLLRKLLPDALFVGEDEIAAELLPVLKEWNYAVPQDIALCGFSGTRMAELTDPPLTVVDREAGKMGEIAARLLLERIRVPGRLTVTKMIKPRLIMRESSRK